MIRIKRETRADTNKIENLQSFVVGTINSGGTTMTVSLLEAKQNLEDLLHKAAAGESVVITLENENVDRYAQPHLASQEVRNLAIKDT